MVPPAPGGGAARYTTRSCGAVGLYTSVAIGTDNNPVISYYDKTTADLKVAHCNDLACSGAALAALDIAGDVDGQIYMRDFKLIDQADMICSYIPQLAGGIPGLSSGVERELQHAHEGGKEVYVIWKPGKSPSPFITETATQVFTSTAEALEFFEEQGMFYQASLFGH